MSQDRNQQLTRCQGIRERKQVISGQDMNQQLTSCQGIRERKQVISRQNVTGQETMTYSLVMPQFGSISYMFHSVSKLILCIAKLASYSHILPRNTHLPRNLDT